MKEEKEKKNIIVRLICQERPDCRVLLAWLFDILSSLEEHKQKREDIVLRTFLAPSDIILHLSDRLFILCFFSSPFSLPRGCTVRLPIPRV